MDDFEANKWMIFGSKTWMILRQRMEGLPVAALVFQRGGLDLESHGQRVDRVGDHADTARSLGVGGLRPVLRQGSEESGSEVGMLLTTSNSLANLLVRLKVGALENIGSR